jgi:hypothetical protein
MQCPSPLRVHFLSRPLRVNRLISVICRVPVPGDPSLWCGPCGGPAAGAPDTRTAHAHTGRHSPHTAREDTHSDYEPDTPTARDRRNHPHYTSMLPCTHYSVISSLSLGYKVTAGPLHSETQNPSRTPAGARGARVPAPRPPLPPALRRRPPHCRPRRPRRRPVPAPPRPLRARLRPGRPTSRPSLPGAPAVMRGPPPAAAGPPDPAAASPPPPASPRRPGRRRRRRRSRSACLRWSESGRLGRRGARSASARRCSPPRSCRSPLQWRGPGPGSERLPGRQRCPAHRRPACARAYACACAFACACVRACVCVCVCAYVRVCVCAYVYARGSHNAVAAMDTTNTQAMLARSTFVRSQTAMGTGCSRVHQGRRQAHALL